MDIQTETNRLLKHMSEFNIALKRGDPSSFIAKKSSFRVDGQIVANREGVEKAIQDLQNRVNADIVGLRFLTRTKTAIAMVDGVYDTGGGKRGWITEIWQIRRGEYQLRATRTRAGSPEATLKKLSQTQQTFVGDGVKDTVVERESAALRKQFKAFRSAYNGGDGKAVTQLFTRGADAIPMFSFLDGRAQFLTGQIAVAAKADRMTDGALVSNPAERSRGSQFVSGEPKMIRFVSPQLAIVDGTAGIAGIPNAHGFAPKELNGVYTDVWRKSGKSWKMEGSRAWF